MVADAAVDTAVADALDSFVVLFVADQASALKDIPVDTEFSDLDLTF